MLKACIAALALSGLLVLPAEAPAAQAIDIYVSASAAPGGDGRASSPFLRVTDAVAAARATRARSKAPIIVHVAPGLYECSYTRVGPGIEPLPIILDVRDLTLEGATELALDARGLPMGPIPGTEASLVAKPALEFPKAMIIIGRTSSGFAGDGVTIRGLVLDARGTSNGAFTRGIPIEAEGVSNLLVERNFITSCEFGVMTRATTGIIRGNLAREAEVGFVAQGGDAASPANILMTGNRSIDAVEFGMIVTPHTFNITLDARVPFPADSPADTIVARVERNDLSGNTKAPHFSAGLRIGMRGPARFSNTAVTSTRASVAVVGNEIANNCFGVVIDAGFPRRFILDPLSGALDATFAGNTIQGNRDAAGIISFTYFDAALDPSLAQTDMKYLEDSLFDLVDETGDLAGFWYDNPAVDPISGTVLDNVLEINGVPYTGSTLP